MSSLVKMTLNQELKKIREILESYGDRISNLEGVKTKKTIKRQITREGAYGYLLEIKDNDFFDTPKTLKQIVQELGRLGHYYKSTSLTNPLQRLIRQKKLGRIGKKENGNM